MSARNYPPLAERLASKLVVMPSGCIEFTGYRDRIGYGTIRGNNGKKQQAHRVSWELRHGPIARGMVVRHKCDNPPCCNPDHLEIGTHADNSRDMVIRGRSLHGERNGRARLTDEQVRQIRSLAELGVDQRSIARRFGISHAYVSYLANGKARVTE